MMMSEVAAGKLIIWFSLFTDLYSNILNESEQLLDFITGHFDLVTQCVLTFIEII